MPLLNLTNGVDSPDSKTLDQALKNIASTALQANPS